MASILEKSKAKLIYSGAEAQIYLGFWHGRKAVFKHRKPKTYRITEIDETIRSRRTVLEAKILRDAKAAGAPSPTVYYINPAEALLVISYIEGSRLKEYLNKIPVEEASKITSEIGSTIGRLHKAGIQHGDPTTSNMILSDDGRVFLVDYGLAQYTVRAEDRAVDLILFERALLSVHYRIHKPCMETFLKAYEKTIGEQYSEVERRRREIKLRGRYIAERLEK